jgi:putative glycerol-1-phosphate prenyltransferase
VKTYNYLQETIEKKGAGLLILIDPDKTTPEKLIKFLRNGFKNSIDAFLVGGSLITKGDIEKIIATIKKETTVPVIIFPGSVNQVYPDADAILYLSLISGRNAEQLIGKHVIAAPMIKKYNIEPISTGYMIIESGSYTSAEYMSNSKPIPRNKPEIAAATALAAQYIGMNFIYLEAGSGAKNSVPAEMIKCVSETVDIPIIVGGGIKEPSDAKEKIIAGAKLIVIGNCFEDEANWQLLKEFDTVVHYKNNL